MSTISLNLTLEETNTVLEALGQMPYARVYLLIQKIQQQATERLQENRRADVQQDGQGEKSSESIGERG